MVSTGLEKVRNFESRSGCLEKSGNFTNISKKKLEKNKK